MESKLTYTLTVEHNAITDEYYVILPEGLLKQVGWQAGDKLKYKKYKSDSFIFYKATNEQQANR